MTAVFCAWCGKVLKPGPTDGPVSHGICAECAKAFDAEIAA